MQHLLSASEDKTVRLWQVGCDCCLRVFPHSNYGALLANFKFLLNICSVNLLASQVELPSSLFCYLFIYFACDAVTCVQFNPVDDNHFMSGSIDGKVRIWAVNSHQVVDWTHIKDIVTAVCYRPDGQV